MLHASGRELKGQGNATADVTVTLTSAVPTWSSTELAISGKIVQYGRGVMVDVSAKLIKEFVECLEEKLAIQGTGTGA